jgi:hypothetical protein
MSLPTMGVWSTDHGAGTTTVHRCSFFVFAAASQQAAGAASIVVALLSLPKLAVENAGNYRGCER